jgi:hypothetical protein
MIAQSDDAPSTAEIPGQRVPSPLVRRRFFTILSATSFATLVTISVLSWPHGGPVGRLIIVKRHDVFHASFLSYAMYAIAGPNGVKWATDGYRVPRENVWSAVGFDLWKATDGTHTGWYVWIPNYALFATTAVLPAWWLFKRLRRRHRLIQRHCADCGYDLRASRDQCPECGTLAN